MFQLFRALVEVLIPVSSDLVMMGNQHALHAWKSLRTRVAPCCCGTGEPAMSQTAQGARDDELLIKKSSDLSN